MTGEVSMLRYAIGYSAKLAASWKQLPAAASIAITMAALPVSLPAQTIEVVTLGSDSAVPNRFGNPQKTETVAGYTTNQYRLPNGVEFSVTLELSSNRIVSLQQSWSGSQAGPSAGFGDFSFGRTKLSDIRSRTSSNGLLYEKILPVAANSSGSVEFSAFYDVAATANVVRFITSIDQEALGNLRQRYGDKAYDKVGSSAVLRSLTISTRDYLERATGAARVLDTGYTPLTWALSFATTNVVERGISLARIRPSQLPVSRVYAGPQNFPDFNGRDSNFSRYRTGITNAMTGGPTFAGEYSVIQIGCGSSCSFAYVGNSRTGEVFDAPVGGQNNLSLKLKYELKSKLLISQWGDYDTNKCFVQFFSFDDGSWTELIKHEVGTLDACAREVGANIK
ncbi:hypothetical protein [Agrobacterium vitis]|uniref:hypothetical protein n=1 Tax=Agrobacterium vitis TaxID=373 RepID=UPI002035D761|nr:hypothetical protein [Agrobacterium vitis]MCM2452218.1 hypothetical protein [Agrobacterium vitis]